MGGNRKNERSNPNTFNDSINKYLSLKRKMVLFQKMKLVITVLGIYQIGGERGV